MNDNMPRNSGASRGMSDVKEGMREKAADLAHGAKEQARAQFDQKKDVARGELDTLASALRRAGSEVSDQGGMSGRVITTLADRIDSFGRSIEGQDLDQMMHGVERFARRNPAAFIGGAVALGFVASRFLKSSGRTFDRDDYYSAEAYGGYRDEGIDSAIGSTAYGMRGGYGTTYGSELDTSRELNRASGLDTTGDVGRSNPFDAASAGTGVSGIGTAGMPDRTAGGLTGSTGSKPSTSPGRTTTSGTRDSDELFDGGNRGGRSGGR